MELLRDHPEAARSPEQRRARKAIVRCRTAAQGGHVYRCDPCGRVEYAYHSCHHRACGQCGGLAGADWLAQRQRQLLPLPYFLVTFTVPEELRALLYYLIDSVLDHSQPAPPPLVLTGIE